MKKNRFLSVITLMTALAFSSCDLERFPLTSLAEENFWNDEKNADLALTALYRGSITNGLEYGVSDFWSYHGLLFMEHLSDNAFDRRGETNGFFQISNGRLTNNNAFIKSYWQSAYMRIGKCNRFLKGIKNCPDTETTRRKIAEARFLRATQYHYLTSYFKDVPLVTTVLTGEEANNVTKETQINILKWCATEFKEAAVDLPRFKDITSTQTGHACKQAALAFLGRTCMLQQDWNSAATAYQEIMDYGDNDIHSTYSELFWPATGVANKENIFYIEYLENYFGCGMPQQCLSAKDGGWSLSNPTAGLFEAYEFNDGTAFSYDDARYNHKNLGENRDPRLDYTIYYNGSNFNGSEYRISPDYDAATKECLDYSSETSKTGFMWRKYFNKAPITDITSYSAVTPIVRYAEVLLSYLECMIESGQPITQEILDATINKVRGRTDVNMPKITDTNPTTLRERVRNARRVDLAFEGIRDWDVMRWQIADKALVGTIWGAPYPESKKYDKATKQVDPTGNCRWYVGRRDFRIPQDYTWPIPLSEQNLNPNLRE